MQKVLTIIIIGVIIISCSKGLKVDSCKEVTKRECFRCHAPFRVFKAMPLANMYNLFGEKQLRISLKEEFAKGKFKDKSHPKLTLSKRDIDKIICYLKHYKDGIHR